MWYRLNVTRPTRFWFWIESSRRAEKEEDMSATVREIFSSHEMHLPPNYDSMCAAAAAGEGEGGEEALSC